MTAPVGFEATYERLDQIVEFLTGEGAGLSHGELETELGLRGRELLRCALQDHLVRLAGSEERVEVQDADGVTRNTVEAGHTRVLATVFGEVTVERLAYRRRGHTNLSPLDAGLNLPAEKHSHGLRRVAAVESARGSFAEAVDAIGRSCGQRVGKRQVEQLAVAAAVDFAGFYASRAYKSVDPADVLVLSADGKGIVMRPEALREPTAKAARTATAQARLAKADKANRKRMATVGAVYDITPKPRCPADIMSPPTPTTGAGGVNTQSGRSRAEAPKAANKWLCASITEDAATVIASVFAEADRRDPNHSRQWIALVDGNNHQIDRLFAEADERGIDLHVICDFIHVLEYLWNAAKAFYDNDHEADAWVQEKATEVLNGNATTVAAAIRRKATYHKLPPWRRVNTQRCADYLAHKAPLLDYPTALANGWPIATGIIEGAVRHLVKDRMDITGARWGLNGAEAILQLRALRINGHFDDYWQHHLKQEHHRIHATRYTTNTTAIAA